MKNYILLVAGCFCIALALNSFLIPNQIASGGISGIANILYHVTGVPVWTCFLSINIPVFLVATWILGKKNSVTSFIGLLLISLFLYVTRGIAPLTDELLLATLYGGLLVGVGLGLVFRAKTSTGGTDLIAQILHKFTGLSLGICLLLIDGLIIITAAILFGAEVGLMALLSLYVTSKTIDLLQQGLSFEKVALIISDKAEEVRMGIFRNLDRGVTQLYGQGGFTKHDRSILMCVVEQKEVTALKEMIKGIDENAFVIIGNAQEVVGRGFRGMKKQEI